MVYTLGDVDWDRFDAAYDLSGLADIDELPFKSFDQSLTYAEWFSGITDEDVWIEENIDLSELEEEYTAVIFDPPENISEEAQKICKSIHWNNAQADVNRLENLGIKPITRIKVSFMYENELSFKELLVFDGESGIISFTLVGNTSSGSKKQRARIFSDGDQYHLWRGGDNEYTDALAKKYEGKFAVILEDAESGMPFRRDVGVDSVEAYLKED